MVYEIAAVALVGLLVWRAGGRWPAASQNRSARWRLVPLATALAVLIAALATFGVGILLAPVAVLMTVLSARRLSSPRGAVFFLGATLSGVLMLGFASAVAIVVHDAFVS